MQQLVDPVGCSSGSLLLPYLDSFLRLALLLAEALGVCAAFLKQRTRVVRLSDYLDLPALLLERLEFVYQSHTRQDGAGH